VQASAFWFNVRPMRHALKWSFAFVALFAASPALASGGEGGALHADPVASVVLALAVILVAAKIGGDIATRLGQPSVLGELVIGVLIGNLPLLGVSAFETIKTDASIDMLSRLGVIILLFEVGLESTVAQMMKVGLSSFVVATVGVIAPFGLGWGVAAWLLPEHSGYVHAFIGAALTATSVGITARVLKDLGRSQTDEARTILGAAVIDDVMGLIVLAVVSGVIAAADSGTELSTLDVGMTLFKAMAFLFGALIIGVNISPKVFAVASLLKARGVLLALGLSFCFLLSWLASVIGLAPIVGAFAAGLVLERVHYKDFVDQGEHELEELIHPISQFLVPVFFVLMGMHTDLRSFADVNVLGLAAALTVAAVIGKQACYFGVIGKGVDRLSVGIGMIPRGEVGLIFANIGMSLSIKGERVVDAATYSAVVVMVIVTTMITPPMLKWSLNRKNATGPGTSTPEPASS
jgi:Kef-type K+ transport system membrane component KefB